MGGATRTLVACAASMLLVAAAAWAQTPLTGEGAWSWFGDPRAVTHDGRTYVGWVDREGDIKVHSFDHATRERVTAVLQGRLQQDDHANPSIQVRPDGRLVVYYSRHNGAAMFYRVSSAPGDVRSWEPPRQIPTNSPGTRGYTYPNPIRLADEQATYLFWRGGNYQPSFSIQPDGSDTWTPARTLLTQPGERPYAKYDSSGGDTIHVAYTNAHPTEFGDVNIYYARIRDGRVEGANGDQVGTLDTPIAPAAGDTVFDGTEQAWVHDVAADASGRPVIVFASFPSAADHRYHYARWTGVDWEVHEIVAAGGSFRGDGGSPFYSGGITLDHEDPSRVYLSRRVGPTWEVETRTTANGGASWSTVPITSGSADKNVRPIAPRGGVPFGGDLDVIWMQGQYDSWTSYATSIATRIGGNAPPVADAEPSARSGRAPLDVRFDDSGSTDPDGAIVAREWSFGDGTGATGSQPIHTYADGGRYFPTLTVTDSSGARDVLVEEIVIDGPTAPAVHTGRGVGATVHGAIDPENQPTTWEVEYGPTTEYGSIVPGGSLPGDDAIHQVSLMLSGLEPGGVYHYRVVATNASGSRTGEDRVFVSGAVPGSDAYRDMVLATEGLGAYWRLGEVAGAAGRDEVTGGLGAFEGRYTLGHAGVLGPLGDGAAGFDGTSGAFAAPGPAVAGSATLEGWFRWRTGTATLRDDTSSAGWLLAFASDGALAYRLGGKGFNTGIPIEAVRDDRWHHLVATKDGAAAALFVDGQLRHSGSGAGPTPAKGPWHVMRNGTTDVFSAGEADEVAIYDRALSAAEVGRHHQLALDLGGVPPLGGGGTIGGAAAGGSPAAPVRTAGGAMPGLAAVSGGRLRVRAGAGVRNRLQARRVGTRWIVRDMGASLRAGAGCRQMASQAVSCAARGLHRVDLLGADRADRLAVVGRTAALLDGGSGADTLIGGAGRNTLRGGSGGDRLIGGETRDVLDGGRGGDLLRGGAGVDLLGGGPGADRLDGGPGRDRIACGSGRDLATADPRDRLVAGRSTCERHRGRL